MNSSVARIVSTAVERGELEALLLGHPAYWYRSKYSPAAQSDITELLSELYRAADFDINSQTGRAFVQALQSIASSYDGIVPLASCILYETMQVRKGSQLGLPLHSLCAQLSALISQHSVRLRDDKSGEGADYPDGMLGELRRLNEVTVSCGGPSFLHPQ